MYLWLGVVVILLDGINSTNYVRNSKGHLLRNIYRMNTVINFGLSTAILPVISPRQSNALEEIDSASFYSRYQYQKPSDFLDYLKGCKIEPGNTKAVIDSMNTFAKYYPMYKLSDVKAQILCNEVKKFKPKNILEIGTFFGFSAINMATCIPNDTTITCIEGNPENYEVAQEVIDLSLGYEKSRQQIHVINSVSTPILSSISSFQTALLQHTKQQITSTSSSLESLQFDFIFIDHDKDCYLKDLQLLEKNNMLANKCVIVADNVVFPGAPRFLEYVNYHGNTVNISDIINNNNKDNDDSNSKDNKQKQLALYTYETILKDAPFERIGFETQFKSVPDAMSVTYGTKNIIS